MLRRECLELRRTRSTQALILWFMIGAAMLIQHKHNKARHALRMYIVRSSPNPSCMGDVMAAKRTWSGLDESARKLIITVVIAEGVLKVAALIDIRRRAARQVQGPKWLWRP
jgi:hypothetical protein